MPVSSFLSSHSLLPSFLFPSSCILTAFFCSLIPSFLPTYFLVPVSLPPSSCLLIPSFLFSLPTLMSPYPLLHASSFHPSCLHISSILSSHCRYKIFIPFALSSHLLILISSSPPFCLLIPSSLSPHPLFLVSSGVRYFPKGIFPRATSQVTISKVATSQMYSFPSDNFPKARLGLLRLQRDWALRVWLARGPSAAASTDLGSLHIWKVVI